MRTNIEIDDEIMQAAMNGGAFKTKREAVEAGLKLLAQQAHYREVLKWKGKLHWDDQPSSKSPGSTATAPVLPKAMTKAVSHRSSVSRKKAKVIA